jgi:hypothetical protein
MTLGTKAVLKEHRDARLVFNDQDSHKIVMRVTGCSLS